MKIAYIRAWNNEADVHIKSKDIMHTKKLTLKGVTPLQSLVIAKESSVSLHLNCDDIEAIKVVKSFDTSFFSILQEFKAVIGELVNYTILDSANQIVEAFLEKEKYSTEAIVVENYCNCLTLERYEKMSQTQKLIFEKISKGTTFSSIQEIEELISIEKHIDAFNELMEGSPCHTAFKNNAEGIAELKKYMEWNDNKFITYLTTSREYRSSNDVIVATTDDEVYSLNICDIQEQLKDLNNN